MNRSSCRLASFAALHTDFSDRSNATESVMAGPSSHVGLDSVRTMVRRKFDNKTNNPDGDP